MGKTDCVKALLEAGVEVDAKDALFAAVALDDVTKVKELIKEGADVNAKTRSGSTALTLAILHGRPDCVKALIEAGADVNAKDKLGRTALKLVATAEGKIDCIILLREAGAKE